MLADGIERISRAAGFSWSAHRLYARSGYTYADRLPRNAAEYYEHANADLDLLKRVYFANRGVWEANVWAGPAVSVAATDEDVEHYLSRARGVRRRAGGVRRMHGHRDRTPSLVESRRRTFVVVGCVTSNRAALLPLCTRVRGI